MRRREFLAGSLGAVALGSLARPSRGFAGKGGTPYTSGQILGSCPIARVPFNPRSEMVDGIPFAPTFTGDGFPKLNIPFHNPENVFPNGPPEPEEHIDVAIVGGGISGLASAILMENFDTVLFELHQRCGGAAQGERWAGTPYSLGNAYVITPDAGTFLDKFYRSLGLQNVVNPDLDEEFTVELGRKVLTDFVSGDQAPEEQAAFDRYLEILSQYAGADYPNIPFAPSEAPLIQRLDRLTLKEHIELEMGGLQVPRALESMIQSYCYSSFSAGWEEISAAGGWNFLAAEIFGRWVFPGGTSYMAHAMWERLTRGDREKGANGRPRVRGSSRVVDVRMTTGDRVLVTYRDPDENLRSLTARRAVMCCPKHVAKSVIHDIEKNDLPKKEAMERLQYRAYVVANVLLEGRFDREFYDIFLLGDGSYPRTSDEASLDSFVTDALNGQFARKADFNKSVLTLYWPLPYDTARFTLVTEESWRNYAESFAAQLPGILETVGLTTDAIRQVRMTRWGHAMPIHQKGLIADGTVDELRRPYEGKIYFVQQDNWALPAVENCLLDAEIFVPQLIEGL